MICHIVLIRLRNEEKADWILRQAREVLGSIAGVHHLRTGKAFRADTSHPICLVMEFDDERALEAYQVHPDHVRFRDHILGPLVEDKVVSDYEVVT